MNKLPENVPFILTASITDSMGEKATIVQLNGFPKKAWSKTAKLRNALYASFMQATNSGLMPSAEEAELQIDDSPEKEKEDDALTGGSLASIIMATDFDVEVNTKRFFTLASDFDLLSVNEKPFTVIQWNELDDMDLERILYEYLAVFLFPSAMKMIQS